MTRRQIMVAAIVICIEVIIPISVFGYMLYNGITISFASFMDIIVSVHEYPIIPIASALMAFGFKTSLAFEIAKILLMICELAVVAAVVWLVAPIYREGRKILADEWAKE